MGLKNEHGQSAIALKSLSWMTLEEQRAQLKAKIMFKTVNGLAPQRLCDILKNVDEIHNYDLRRFFFAKTVAKNSQSAFQLLLKKITSWPSG